MMMNTEPTFVKEDNTQTGNSLGAICFGAIAIASPTAETTRVLHDQEPVGTGEDLQVEVVNQGDLKQNGPTVDVSGKSDEKRLFFPVSTIETRKKTLERYAPLAERLYREHGELVDKKFMDGLSPKEEKHLEYIQYQLNMYEDAENGDHIDAYAARVDSFTQYATEIRQLKKELLDTLPRRKKTTKKRK